MKNIDKTALITTIVFVTGLLLFYCWANVQLELDTSPHCKDCPSETCLCIQDVDGAWMLSPEVGDTNESW